ncbi:MULTISPECIES: hypothetical protein [unclassified Methylosinus]|uniref:hypothetical protein n=1 Tax=unclassified Methylosinus TaxID=2624500 RepID=UPI001416F21D|nr:MULTISPECIES: hypothetical protein [unclassified Methylosinus]
MVLVKSRSSENSAVICDVRLEFGKAPKPQISPCAHASICGHGHAAAPPARAFTHIAAIRRGPL